MNTIVHSCIAAGKQSCARLLEKKGMEIPAEEWIRQRVGYGAAFSIIVLGVFLATERGMVLSLAAFGGAFCIPFFLSYFWLQYSWEQKKKRMEESMPDLLLLASSYPLGTPMLTLLEKMGEETNELGAEFRRALGEIHRGSSVYLALEGIIERCESYAIRRGVSLLIHWYHAGGDMGIAFREAAEDMMETAGILRERNTQLIIEKYTLLLAGGIIVPLVLGLIAGLVQGFQFGSLSSLELGLSTEAREALLDAALLGNLIYISEYAVIAALFVGLQEDNPSRGILYALLLTPLSLGIYFFGQWI